MLPAPRWSFIYTCDGKKIWKKHEGKSNPDVNYSRGRSGPDWICVHKMAGRIQLKPTHPLYGSNYETVGVNSVWAHQRAACLHLFCLWGAKQNCYFHICQKLAKDTKWVLEFRGDQLSFLEMILSAAPLRWVIKAVLLITSYTVI